MGSGTLNKALHRQYSRIPLALLSFLLAISFVARAVATPTAVEHDPFNQTFGEPGDKRRLSCSAHRDASDANHGSV